MATRKVKFRVMKYNGDDCYSYAVFKAEDVRGLKSPIIPTEADPIVCGCSRAEANHYKRDLEARHENCG